MEGRFPLGIRMVWANCTSPALTAEFNHWYDHVHVPDLLATGLATHGLRGRLSEIINLTQRATFRRLRPIG